MCVCHYKNAPHLMCVCVCTLVGTEEDYDEDAAPGEEDDDDEEVEEEEDDKESGEEEDDDLSGEVGLDGRNSLFILLAWG